MTPKEMVEFALKRKLSPELFKDKFGLETMGEKYHALFTTLKLPIYEV